MAGCLKTFTAVFEHHQSYIDASGAVKCVLIATQKVISKRKVKLTCPYYNAVLF